MIEDYIGKITMGDCLDILKEFEDNSINLCLCNPPYGIKRDKGFGGQRGFSGQGSPIEVRSYDDEWDRERPDKKCFNELLRVSKSAIVFGGNYFTDLLPQSNHWIFWDKINTMPTFGDGELIWTNINRNSVKKFVLEYNGLLGKEQERIHPTQKPVNLFTWLLYHYSKENDLILDCFSGSGTTAIAAHRMKRRFICIEKETKYVELSRKRLKEEQSQMVLEL